ncbi:MULTISPECIES: sensor histidine kinase [unclassified Variovorax]|uniref:sensor histidine kinase n=1 Tax=unclassified Variovorax TaxID=663243 RepID=UPI0025784392|nr:MULTISPECIES: sensor histidine kinase [unclassified Variovorax]MDM0086856.1 sensor histidine kinase N-terminal domain-containing protein [Variovorax sp. J22G40]MDM0144888.1 sensor histidine kinase N-terminal domain-containing protein [Variovorax sp. J2P1-31]
MSKPSRVRRLQNELNFRLMLPVLAIVALTGLLGAFAAQKLVDRVFDRWLLDTARALADQVRVVDGKPVIELSRQAEALLTYDMVDRSYFEVRQDDRHLLGQVGLPLHGDRESTYSMGARAYDARFHGTDVRVAWVPVQRPGAAGLVVLSAETLVKRHRAQGDLFWTMAPIGGLFLVAVLVIGLTVRRTIGPLERIAARWNERSHASLDPIPVDDVPRELMPFASALNDLLLRIRTMLARERQFASTVAHQLRTPLTGLRLGLARAAEAPDTASMRAVVNELGATTQRTARLVQQLLSMGRLDLEGRSDLALVPVDLGALAREVGETYLDAALEKQIELELVSGDAPVRVRGEPDLLGEALGNLIDNAIRCTPAGGSVLISIGRSPPSLGVADSGPGVPAEQRAAMFERFVRGPEPSGEGTGLGLAIVREIAVLHGAEVQLCDSETGGASVTIRFPAADAAAG